MTTNTDPNVAGWRRAVSSLGSDLVSFESNTTVTLARTGCLEGESAAAWAAADASVAAAWATYHAMNELVTAAENDPPRAPALLTSTMVPGRAGQTDPTTAMRDAKVAIVDGTAVAVRLAAAWGDWASRVAAASHAAETAGDSATIRACTALGALLTTDPFAVALSDVEQVEESAAKSADRHNAAELAVARLQIDLAKARTTVDELKAQAGGADAELAHACSRITGITPATPVRDLDALVEWLDRIAAGATNAPSRAAAELDDWIAAAAARQAELDQVLAPARAGMRRREEGRGLWTALRAKAAGRHIEERPDVAAALEEARELLWVVPCDLDLAEAALARLAATLESKGPT